MANDFPQPKINSFVAKPQLKFYWFKQILTSTKVVLTGNHPYTCLSSTWHTGKIPVTYSNIVTSRPQFNNKYFPFCAHAIISDGTMLNRPTSVYQMSALLSE